MRKNNKAGRTVIFWLLLIGLTGLLNIGYAALERSREDLVPEKLKHLTGMRMEAADTLDLVVIGNSLSYTSISPMQLWNAAGIAGYNCGHSGQTVQEAYETLREVCRSQKPSTVLLETSLLFGKQSNAAKAWADRFDTWKGILAGEFFEEEHYKGFAFRRNVQPYSGGEYMTETSGASAEASGAGDGIAPAEEETKALSEQLATDAERYIGKIAGLCREKGIRLILFSTTSPVNYTAEQVELLEKLSESLEVEYVDFNRPSMREMIGIDWETDSLDGGDHLNDRGAQKITAFFEDFLSDGSLPDHRGEQQYESWEQEGAAYALEADAA